MIPLFETIEKESISELRFPLTDVLTDKDAKKLRDSELQRALLLGNIEHSKIRIYFEDIDSKKMVETTVWGLTDNRVILKKGIGIPINRIYKSF
ncbi:hypothetical protein HUK80_15420 [Flavobacterium sp. MAH-1]|uniref:Uncharacterized protein n=1 Tax=Flavobacterium agri TaxID=2743471 RepID=A0A7Y9C8B6_9FLAO|nr:hypothetical protein [Flavobacterium agri]NUY82294.1 hypothetical protein [Flavobacterium agri]NYA72318.1 hypothetical protein [Flavobacterium agri]